MSLLDRLLGRKPPVVTPELVERVLTTVGNVVDAVRDRAEARERLARAARRGDLDFLLNAVEADKKRAEDYVRNG